MDAKQFPTVAEAYQQTPAREEMQEVRLGDRLIMNEDGDAYVVAAWPKWMIGLTDIKTGARFGDGQEVDEYDSPFQSDTIRALTSEQGMSPADWSLQRRGSTTIVTLIRTIPASDGPGLLVGDVLELPDDLGRLRMVVRGISGIGTVIVTGPHAGSYGLEPRIMKCGLRLSAQEAIDLIGPRCFETWRIVGHDLREVLAREGK